MALGTIGCTPLHVAEPDQASTAVFGTHFSQATPRAILSKLRARGAIDSAAGDVVSCPWLTYFNIFRCNVSLFHGAQAFTGKWILELRIAQTTPSAKPIARIRIRLNTGPFGMNIHY